MIFFGCSRRQTETNLGVFVLVNSCGTVAQENTFLERCVQCVAVCRNVLQCTKYVVIVFSAREYLLGKVPVERGNVLQCVAFGVRVWSAVCGPFFFWETRARTHTCTLKHTCTHVLHIHTHRASYIFACALFLYMHTTRIYCTCIYAYYASILHMCLYIELRICIYVYIHIELVYMHIYCICIYT